MGFLRRQHGHRAASRKAGSRKKPDRRSQAEAAGTNRIPTGEEDLLALRRHQHVGHPYADRFFALPSWTNCTFP